MIYSIHEIQQRIAPVVKQYGVKAVFLFGSYARGEAREDSDIDLLVDVHIGRLRERFRDNPDFKIVISVKSRDSRRFFIGFIGFSFLKMRNKKSRPCDLLLRES